MPHSGHSISKPRKCKSGRLQTCNYLGVGSREELLAEATIKAVYITRPNNLHVPWLIRALEAGKHVLCEKPIGLSFSDVHKLQDSVANMWVFDAVVQSVPQGCWITL